MEINKDRIISSSSVSVLELLYPELLPCNILYALEKPFFSGYHFLIE